LQVDAGQVEVTQGMINGTAACFARIDGQISANFRIRTLQVDIL